MSGVVVPGVNAFPPEDDPGQCNVFGHEPVDGACEVCGKPVLPGRGRDDDYTAEAIDRASEKD